MTSDSTDRTASIHLDYDADSAPFDLRASTFARAECVCARGGFSNRGTELSVNFQLADPASDPHRRARILRTEGYVVECQPLPVGSGGYEVTVAFWEVTDDILAVIRDVLPSAAVHE